MTAGLPAPVTSGTRQTPLGPVGAAVHQHITWLQRGYLDDRSDAVGALARLRRGIGRPAGETADLWGLIGTEPLHELYERRELTEGALQQAEEAAHAAVTLWSLHQQSHHAARMHRRPGLELGAAVRRLAPGAEIDEPTRKRFVRAGAAATPVVLAGRLRELVLLLRREAIALDYGLLADQLQTWQSPGGTQSVRRSWGRSYLAAPRPASDSGSATAGRNAPGDSDGTQDPDMTTPEDHTP
ncbi:type I-E CRISPR-associated protein Cse2/CasB [Streptomyces corynorhini]|uniref:Type I-E CRISPR-associated protein Cse2/CasB n=1 Tax=Streptomyces corynorhini TaxID=2282652 RepID=A0A370BGK3_9ACTN|nr:type I-E CRISPR-associated protein Cse2/CasB [Streptomyces corynorhini]RDG38923.1 type I-E CRISPR-associated protein Cse2/CasB [Streptomyces corynorhini]